MLLGRFFHLECLNIGGQDCDGRAAVGFGHPHGLIDHELCVYGRGDGLYENRDIAAGTF